MFNAVNFRTNQAAQAGACNSGSNILALSILSNLFSDLAKKISPNSKMQSSHCILKREPLLVLMPWSVRSFVDGLSVLDKLQPDKAL